ncbi:hypothetical protein [Paucisalibacillus globulus]|uniref:hypothetical protein n=1 Tax=Paucisalibacillus globulus TaxID=351095 RepID=UPI000426BEAC|nr:hypothetical protein [Paucisalibacillus globulus]
MSNDKLGNRLASMPKANLTSEKKEKMLYAITQQKDKKQGKNSLKKTTGWIAPLGGVIMVAFLVLIIVIPNFKDSPQAFLAEEQLHDIQKLEKFSGMIQLPTYAPFTVGEVYYDELFVNGIDDIIEGNAEFIQPQITYYSSDGPEKLLTISMINTAHDHLYTKVGDGDYNEIVDFGNGLKAEYYTPSDEISHFSWIERDMFISLSVVSPESEPIPLEEVIKIAESFELYEVNSEDQ